jgi:hypothetical protein
VGLITSPPSVSRLSRAGVGEPGVNYPKWGKNENLGGNEGSINIQIKLHEYLLFNNLCVRRTRHTMSHFILIVILQLWFYLSTQGVRQLHTHFQGVREVLKVENHWLRL